MHAFNQGDAIVTEESYPVGKWRAVITLLLLGSLYLMSFIDRIILALLVNPLKNDLGISDVQLGLLFGTAFAIFYGVLGLPLARVADHSNRRRLIVFGALLWSASTIASGFATSFAMLVVLRFGLAIGEAALTPAAFSMIGDLFPRHRRSRAASVYSAFGMLGASGSYIFGGLLVGALDLHLVDGALWGFRVWQLVFFCVGVPALLLAFLFAAFAREPARAVGIIDKPVPPMNEVTTLVLRRFRLFGLLLLGAGLCQVPAYALAAWMPHYLDQRFGFGVRQAGLLYGCIGIAASVGGSLVLPYVTDRLRRAGRANALPMASGVAALGGVAAMVVAGALTNVGPFLVAVALGLFLLTGATNNVFAGFQLLVPPRMRATFAALCLMSITLLGLGVGPPVLALFNGQTSVPSLPGLGIIALALGAALPGALCFLLSRETPPGGPASRHLS